MADVQPWILMCPPEYFGIEYEINPWMKRAHAADHGRAVRQWERLHAAILSLGVKVSLLEPVAGLPDMVFTANAGMMFHQRFYSSRFRFDERAGESPHFERWMREQGFSVYRLPPSFYFEGAGDALFCGPTLFAAYGFRSHVESHQFVGRLVGHTVLPLQLVDGRFYHLDTCFCPLEPGRAIWYPGAFDEYAQAVVRANVRDLIAAETDEALRFACNAVVVGRTVVHPADCPHLRRELNSRGFDSIEVELGEFLKAGGSAKCLSLRLDGEEAAVWDSLGEREETVLPPVGGMHWNHVALDTTGFANT